ncbi:MAG: 2-hydroxychromene-2-carboxylate isomerase [uncultured Paraburkholderia sp.]|nr:MAG: 2-hydroxychromene-2-carboxylate isomerase [uncultured Paraburkholderia sp.]CAH2944461.1 MAG: 2-hydroxychromene-2-carboxylate isomerase [uncultured Paraburkholderia sp.]
MNDSHDAHDVDFYFDFISPFGYFASLRIDALAANHARKVRWHPVLIGVTVMKIMGSKPMIDSAERRLHRQGSRTLCAPTPHCAHTRHSQATDEPASRDACIRVAR